MAAGSVSFWPVEALVRARALNFSVPGDAVERGLAWLEGSAGGEGARSVSPRDGAAHVCGAGLSAAFAAAAALAREDGPAAGRSRTPAARRAVDRLLRAAASHRKDLDPYEAYMYARVLERAGRPEARAWRDASWSVLKASQVAAGPLAGSWDAKDKFTSAGGRPCATALCALVLRPSGKGAIDGRP
jgi:hypothetical protein